MCFPFHEDENTATIICRHVARGENPILYASHDKEDGMWQFLCGNKHTVSELMLVTLRQAFERDTSIGALKDLPRGKEAWRNHPIDQWHV